MINLEGLRAQREMMIPASWHISREVPISYNNRRGIQEGYTTLQPPNRIHFSENGILCRIMLSAFGDNNYQAYMEFIRCTQLAWATESGRTLIADDPRYLEERIKLRRAENEVTGDLLLHPQAVYRVLDGKGDEYVHLVKNKEGALLSCRYVLTKRGPERMIIHLWQRQKPEGQLVPVSEVPPEIRAYTNPFGIAA